MRIKIRKERKILGLSSTESYVVYAIYLKSPVEFMIQGDFSEPSFVSSEDVEIIDNRLSSIWTYAKPQPDSPAILSFKEWATDWSFFENLVNGRNHDVWELNRNFMDIEFANPNVKNTASHVKGNWFECDNCLNTWETNPNQEVVLCPECKVWLNKECPNTL